jgi:asparagine synthase (glutamine-hydrolysing)
VWADPRKRGFPTPFDRAARGAGREAVADWLAERRFRERGWWDAAACRALLDAERPAHDRSLFFVLALEWWARHFLDSSGAEGEARAA